MALRSTTNGAAQEGDLNPLSSLFSPYREYFADASQERSVEHAACHHELKPRDEETSADRIARLEADSFLAELGKHLEDTTLGASSHLTGIRNVLVEIQHKKLLSQAGVNSLLTIMLYGLEGVMSKISSPLRICMYQQGNVYVPAFYRSPPTDHQYLPGTQLVDRGLPPAKYVPWHPSTKEAEATAAESNASIQSQRIPKSLVRDPPYHPAVVSLFNNRETIYVNRETSYSKSQSDPPDKLVDGNYNMKSIVNWQLARFVPTEDAFDASLFTANMRQLYGGTPELSIDDHVFSSMLRDTGDHDLVKFASSDELARRFQLGLTGGF
ncbi:unnamed protein product, partial [Clonostachys chloroleuca]